MTQLGVILGDFPEEVVTYITSPKTGLQRRSKWPPTISEVLAACEDHQVHLERLRTRVPLSVRLPRPVMDRLTPGSLAKIFVPEGHVRYAGLVAWTETAQDPYWKFGMSSDGRSGLWVSYDAWDGNQNINRSNSGLPAIPQEREVQSGQTERET